MGIMRDESRRHNSRRFLKRVFANRTMDMMTAQREYDLQKYQVVGFVKKAIADDKILRERLFESIKKSVPDNDKAIEIFEQQLENITSRCPQGSFDIDSFGEQYLSYLELGDYAVHVEDENDNLSKEIRGIVKDARDQGIETDHNETTNDYTKLVHRSQRKRN